MISLSRPTSFSRNLTIIILAVTLFYLPAILAILNAYHEPKDHTITSLIMATSYIVIFCLNYYLIVPLFLISTEKRGLFILLNVIFIIGSCSIVPIWYEAHGGLPQPGPREHHIQHPSTFQYLMGYVRFLIRDIIMMILAVGLALAMRLSLEREKMRQRMYELRTEKQHIEIQNLKAQLNPHFLFNTLNNIYTLIGFDPERAQKSLHELSGMLRFMIYDSTSSFVPLHKELQFIREYIELMKLRLNASVAQKFDIMEDATADLYVAPLLYLTIIENAFKHFAPNDKGNLIEIKIFIDIDDNINKEVLFCRVRNSYSFKSRQNSSEVGIPEKPTSGIGLGNVKKQLELIYKDKYLFILEDNKESGIFLAEIKIPIYVLRDYKTII